MNDYPRERSAATLWRRGTILSLAALFFAASQAQSEGDAETLFELSPFELTADVDVGYRATHTLAGTRMARGNRVQALVESVDLYPALCDLAGCDSKTNGDSFGET